jgi:hypothetical protein
VQTLSYHILRRDTVGTPIWIEAAASLEAARARVLELAERFAGEYVIFHRETAKIVANFHCKQVALSPTFSSYLPK